MESGNLAFCHLDWLFANNADVFVAGDLLWYPVEGDNKTRQAPDVMVAFGRPKGERGSYQQWKENNIPPQVVFEILSPGNTPTEMTRKLLFYDRHGRSIVRLTAAYAIPGWLGKLMDNLFLGRVVESTLQADLERFRLYALNIVNNTPPR